MIAQAGGLTYNLPQRQFAQQQAQPVMQQEAQPQGGSPFDIPMGEDLAFVENLTNNYYTSYGRLKDFTETMWKDYGVDVTKPDFTQPGGGLMHDTFLRMDADLRMAANDLAQEKKIREEQRKAVLEGKAMYAPGYREEAQLARTLAPMKRVIPTDYLYPEVEEAVQGVLNKVYNTPSESEAAFETVKPLIARFEELKKNDPANSAIYDQQLRALNRRPTYSLPDSYFTQTAKAAAAADKDARFANYAKKIANEWKGNWTTYDDTIYDPVLKQQVFIIKPEGSLLMGKATVDGQSEDKILKYYIKDQTGAVYAEFDNPKIPRERLDTRSSDEAVTTVFANNPRYGGTDAIEYLNRLRGVTGTFEVQALYPNQQEYEQVLQAGEQTTKQIANAQQALNTAKEKISTRLGSPSGFRGRTIQIKDLLADYPDIAKLIPEGTLDTETKGGFLNIGGTSGFIFDEGEAFNKIKEAYKKATGVIIEDNVLYSKDEIIDILSEYVGAAAKKELGAVPITTQGTTKKTMTAAQFSAAVKKYGLTDQQDIDTYRKELESKGYTIQ